MYVKKNYLWSSGVLQPSKKYWNEKISKNVVIIYKAFIKPKNLYGTLKPSKSSRNDKVSKMFLIGESFIYVQMRKSPMFE